MSRIVGCVSIGLVLVLLLSACGASSESAPDLVALPTRTPVPPTPTPAPLQATSGYPLLPEPGEALAVEVQDMSAHYEVVSLEADVVAYLDAADESNVTQYTFVVEDELIGPAGSCLELPLWPRVQALQLFVSNGPFLPPTWSSFGITWGDINEAWRISIDEFVFDDQAAAVGQGLDRAMSALPPDESRVLQVCIMPGPSYQIFADGALTAMTGLDSMLINCTIGEDCLPDIELNVAVGYYTLYQLQRYSQPADELSLQTWMVTLGRSLYALMVANPGSGIFDGVAPDQIIPLELEETLWGNMQPDLGDEYDVTRGNSRVSRFLFGNPQDQDDYPLWGGVLIGYQIVQAYVESHPGLSLPELMAVPADELFEESGYTP
ncbi:MAG: DUF2268 domain-containing protein [Chloroflexi bacterium]|nr:DUF2268 domain-containing protein [Chloroflexota bacterium]